MRATRHYKDGYREDGQYVYVFPNLKNRLEPYRLEPPFINQAHKIGLSTAANPLFIAFDLIFIFCFMLVKKAISPFTLFYPLIFGDGNPISDKSV